MLVNLNGDLLAIGGNDGVQHVQQGVPSLPGPPHTTFLLPFPVHDLRVSRATKQCLIH